MDKHQVTRGVLTVGSGRGFMVEGKRDRLVITAAHCLPSLPLCMSFSYERTYLALLAALGAPPAVATECLFADPIADIAVLGPPDSQEFSDEKITYESLMGTLNPINIADSKQKSDAWLLSLQNNWFRCTTHHRGGPLRIVLAAQEIVVGMSGSPIITDEGVAFGVLCAAGDSVDRRAVEGGPNPYLLANLPGWLLDELVFAG